MAIRLLHVDKWNTLILMDSVTFMDPINGMHFIQKCCGGKTSVMVSS